MHSSMLSRWKLLLSCVLIGWGMAGNSIAQAPQEYRQALYDAVALLQQMPEVTPLTDRQAVIQQAHQELELLSDEQIIDVFSNAISLPELQQLMIEAQFEIIDYQLAAEPNTREIEVPELDVEPSFCANTPPAVFFAVLTLKHVLKTIFESLRFECQQQLLGENGALACLIPALILIAAETEVDLAGFCLSEQRAASGEAILELDREIGEHLNEFIDETTISSRATQESLDDVQSDVTDVISDIDDTQDDLDTGFAVLDDDLGDMLTELTGLQADLASLIAQASDIQFRIQVNQADIEDIQDRTADLQQSTAEIKSMLQSIAGNTSTLQISAAELLEQLADGFSQVNLDAIGAGLSVPTGGVPDHALPISFGGQLEQAREIVIRAITAMDSLGIGKTTTALSLVAQGDQAFNAQDFISAYSFFAQAYQALLASGNNR